MTELTPKQEAFCFAYIQTGNASEAYRRAYNAGKMKAETINETASRLLADPKIAARVAALRKTAETEAVMSAAETLEAISTLARFDPRKLFDADGNPLRIGDLDNATAMGLVGVTASTFEGVTTCRYKFGDRNAALEKLARHHGLYSKDNEQTRPTVRIIDLTGTQHSEST